jgi:hypothetical protein
MKAHALSRDELINILTVYQGTTTADGLVGGTTLIDADLFGLNDFVTGKTILIMSGAALGETKSATVFAPLTGTITFAAFSTRILAGINYRILTVDLTTVLAILAGLNVPAADAVTNALSRDIVGNKTDAAVIIVSGVNSIIAYVKGCLNQLATLITRVGDPSGHTLTSTTDKLGDLARSLAIILGTRWNAAGDLGTDVLALLTNLGNASAHTLTSMTAKFGDLARSLKLIIGTRWDAAGDLGTDILTLLTNTAATVAGRLQTKATTIDLNQVAGTYDLFTGATQDVLLSGLVIRMSGGAVAGAVTSISIQTNSATPQVCITALEGAVANLTNEAQLSWATFGGNILLKVGSKIQLTINGGAAGVARVCDVVAEYKAIVSGGSLS